MSNDAYKDPRWQKKRLQILERDQWKCLACSDSQNTLHVHHFYYDGEPWDVPDSALQTLCEQCHADLGPHPKGGVAWFTDDQVPYVIVAWCPQCGNQKFQTKASCYKCVSCSWSTSAYDEVHLGKSIELVEESRPKNKSAYSVSWIKGIVTKARNSGITDVQLLEALFPDCPCLAEVTRIRDLMNELTATLKAPGLTVDQEVCIVERLVRFRRETHDLLVIWQTVNAEANSDGS